MMRYRRANDLAQRLTQVNIYYSRAEKASRNICQIILTKVVA